VEEGIKPDFENGLKIRLSFRVMTELNKSVILDKVTVLSKILECSRMFDGPSKRPTNFVIGPQHG
jgi:hypothetical protein